MGRAARRNLAMARSVRAGRAEAMATPGARARHTSIAIASAPAERTAAALRSKATSGDDA
jgi:hypothetical protein